MVQKSGPPPSPKPTSAPPPAYGDSNRGLTSQQPSNSPRASASGWGAEPGPSYSPSTIYAIMHLARTDRIRLLGFPGTVVRPLEQIIRTTWPWGIKDATQSDNVSYEWKLGGAPWEGQGNEYVPSRRLMCQLLHWLGRLGWHLSFSVDLSKKSGDKDSLMFKLGPVVSRQFFSISFHMSNSIRIIDPPTPEVQLSFIDVVKTWPMGIQDERIKETGCYHLKLRGNPWWTSEPTQANQSRLLAARILSAMDQQGYDLVGSVDMSQSGDSDAANSELESWFFASKIS